MPAGNPRETLVKFSYHRAGSDSRSNMYSMLYVLAGAFCLFALAFSNHTTSSTLMRVGLFCGGCTVTTFAVFLLVYWRRTKFKIWRLCGDGFSVETPAGVSTLKDAEIRSVNWSSARIHFEGAFAYEAVDFIIEGLETRFRFSDQAQVIPRELCDIRDELSRRLAQRWADLLRNGRSPFWARDVTFTPGGLKVVSRGQEWVIGYTQVTKVDFSEGICLITTSDQYRTTLRIPTKEPNFFPGFFLLVTLVPNAEMPLPE